MSRNQYPGICYRCGKTVAAGEGHYEKNRADKRNIPRNEIGKWRLQHAECAIKYRGTHHHYKTATAP